MRQTRYLCRVQIGLYTTIASWLIAVVLDNLRRSRSYLRHFRAAVIVFANQRGTGRSPWLSTYLSPDFRIALRASGKVKPLRHSSLSPVGEQAFTTSATPLIRSRQLDFSFQLASLPLLLLNLPPPQKSSVLVSTN